MQLPHDVLQRVKVCVCVCVCVCVFCGPNRRDDAGSGCGGRVLTDAVAKCSPVHTGPYRQRQVRSGTRGSLDPRSQHGPCVWGGAQQEGLVHRGCDSGVCAANGAGTHDVPRAANAGGGFGPARRRRCGLRSAPAPLQVHCCGSRAALLASLPWLVPCTG